MGEHGWTAVLVISLLVNLCPAVAPAPRQGGSGRAEKRLLEILEKQMGSAAKAPIKFVVFWEDGTGACAFAVDKLTFEKKTWARVSSARVANYNLEGGKEKVRYTIEGAEVLLEFDRPVGSLQDLRKAKLRRLKGDIILRAGRKE